MTYYSLPRNLLKLRLRPSKVADARFIKTIFIRKVCLYVNLAKIKSIDFETKFKTINLNMY